MSKDSISHNVELKTEKEAEDFVNALKTCVERKAVNLESEAEILASQVLTQEEIRRMRDEKLIRSFIDMLIAEMHDREYMGVKYKQGVFSDDDLYQLENKFFEDENYDK